MESQWLRCNQIVEGMFSDEKTVTIPRLGGHEESFFVPTSFVRGDQLRVEVLKRGAQTWVTLPTSERPQIAVPADRLAPE